MTFDLYTKIALTMIAGALFAIVPQDAIQSASAIETKCAGSFVNPCIVEVRGDIAVRVMN